MSWAIKTTNLSRSFGKVNAVRDLNLQVPEGSVYGFLGPNGAGKTTTIRMLLGLIRPGGGDIRLNGVDVHKQRSAALSGVGAIVESPALYPSLTGRQIMRLSTNLAGLSAREGEERLSQVGLTDSMDRRVQTYSLGMRQRLALARAMLGNPKLLILDEPMNGLDPAGIADMRALIRDLPQMLGSTVFLSSHLLSEIEHTASHCALIHQGELVFQDRLDDLLAQAASILVIETNRPLDLRVRFENRDLRTDQEGNRVKVHLKTTQSERGALMRTLLDEGFMVFGLWEERASLEELFLTITSQRSS